MEGVQLTISEVKVRRKQSSSMVFKTVFVLRIFAGWRRLDRWVVWQSLLPNGSPLG